MRVIATADTFCKAILDVNTLPPNLITISKEILDDRFYKLIISNAAKVQMDIVKKRLQAILNPENPANCPPEFVMPAGMIE
jgi:hypothetical protein